MKKSLIVLAVLAAAVPAAMAQGSDTGQWLVRGRVLNLDPANKDSTGLGLSVNDKVFPEVDVSYFVTPNVAVELVLTYPQKHTVRSNGADIGTLKHLPPTLSLQYHFTGMAVRPYVGVGLNYTHFSSVSFKPAVVTALAPTVEKNSLGLALGAGVDFPVGNGWVLNFDVKKVKIETDVSSFGKKAGTFKVDPVLVSLGAGLRF